MKRLVLSILLLGLLVLLSACGDQPTQISQTVDNPASRVGSIQSSGAGIDCGNFYLNAPEGWTVEPKASPVMVGFAADGNFNSQQDPYWELNIAAVPADSPAAKALVQEQQELRSGTAVQEKDFKGYPLYFTSYPAYRDNGKVYFFRGTSNLLADGSSSYQFEFTLNNCPPELLENALTVLDGISLDF